MAFVLANLLVYFAGWSTVFWVYTFGAVGLVVFALHQFRLPARRRSHVEWRSAQWIVPWLAGLAVISWQGRYASTPSTVFGIALNPQNHLPNWWDLAIVAAFSSIVYAWAVSVSLSSAKVRAAIAELAAEAAVD